jgi:hypothetical protein
LHVIARLWLATATVAVVLPQPDGP